MRKQCSCSVIVFLGYAVSLGVATEHKPNVLLLCVDDLRPELNCFGAEYIHSPNIDRLAAKGCLFHHHYVNSPTCGASRYTLLTGQYGPGGNQALFQRGERMKREPDAVRPSLPGWFRRHGYVTVSVGKVSHHPGGLGGKDWNDPAIVEMPEAWHQSLMPAGKWKTPRGAMHGLADGAVRVPQMSKAIESMAGPDTLYPDGLIADEGMRQLERLARGGQPFFLAIGLIKPHLPFGAPQKYMRSYEEARLPPIAHSTKPTGRTTWHRSGEFFKGYDHAGRDPRMDSDYADAVRRHYAACVTYADKHVGDILQKLEQLNQQENTIVVLWGDHGWHLGEHAIWGKHSLFEEALRAPLIISAPNSERKGLKRKPSLRRSMCSRHFANSPISQYQEHASVFLSFPKSHRPKLPGTLPIVTTEKPSPSAQSSIDLCFTTMGLPNCMIIIR